jgi:hypothetical protein
MDSLPLPPNLAPFSNENTSGDCNLHSFESFPFRRVQRTSSEEYITIQVVPHRKHLDTKINRFVLLKKNIAVYCRNRTKHKYTLCGQNEEFQYTEAHGAHNNY